MSEEYKDLEKLWKFELINKVLFLQQQLKDKDEKISKVNKYCQIVNNSDYVYGQDKITIDILKILSNNKED